jgi:hypothetical protein
VERLRGQNEAASSHLLVASRSTAHRSATTQPAESWDVVPAKSKIALRLAVVLGGVLPLLGTTVFKSVAASFWAAGLVLLLGAFGYALRQRGNA